ncbi:hypothetical protein BCR44DRAFT_66734 [Catenaria anguillulae PL171]|uniref:Transmembrane protein n=1 Tax=Catenaria anguillulae PL171 TaxID=765915 RepID=A0A1Y2HLY1_9FUNG|nr:hypothetical protein BCR44DRAFT_66734 [Catenaria anguillulae PL171]
MWLVFGHRLLEDLTVTTLSLDGVSSSDTFLMYSVSNFIIVTMRDCGIVNDMVFGLANKVSVGALYAAELPFDDKLALAAFSDPIPSSSSPTSPKGTSPPQAPQPIIATAVASSPTTPATLSPPVASQTLSPSSPPKLEFSQLPSSGSRLLSPLTLSDPYSPITTSEVPPPHAAPIGSAVPVQQPLHLAPSTLSAGNTSQRSQRSRSGSALKHELVVSECSLSDVAIESQATEASVETPGQEPRDVTAGHGKPGSFASGSTPAITAPAGGGHSASAHASDAARQDGHSGASGHGDPHGDGLTVSEGGLMLSIASISMPVLATSMSFSTTASSQTPMLPESPSSPPTWSHGSKPAPSPISTIRNNLPRIGSVPLHTPPNRDPPCQSSALSLLPSVTLLQQQQHQQSRQVSSPTSATPGVTPSSAPLPPLLALWTEELREQVARTEHSLVARIATMISMFAAFALEAHFHVERPNWNYRLALLAGLTASAAIAQIAVLWILGSKVHRFNELLLRVWRKREKKFEEWRSKRGGRPVGGGGGGALATPTASMTGVGQTTSVRSIKWTDSESIMSTASLPDPQSSNVSLSTTASTAALEPRAIESSTQQQSTKKKSKSRSKEKEAEKREQRRRRESKRRFERLHLVRFWNSDFSVATSPTLIVMLVLFATVSRFQPEERV